jgi:GTP-binding protein
MARESKRPLVAIVGRPNVGKSTLFNRILGERLAIVEPTAGVTRDRLILPVDLPDEELRFDLMDTGGIGIVDRHDLAESVEFQVETGIHRADVVLFLVDAREGRTPLDEKVAARLRKADVPILLLANKCESKEAEFGVADFIPLGFDPLLPISAQEGRGMEDLFISLHHLLPPQEEIPEATGERLRIAVLGRRNTGKSSFVNALLGEQRVIVSEVPGTTRDAVDVDFEWKGRPLTLVDTAGVHRRTKVADAVEYFSLTRTDQAVRRADVALLFLDLLEPVVRLDQELARTAIDRYKPSVVVGTKTDLVPDETNRDFRDRVEHKLPHLQESPLCRISNTEGRGLDKVLDLAFSLHEEAAKRIGTGELNRALRASFATLRFRGRGQKPKAYYATQLKTSPPTFLLFVNENRLFEKEILRTLSRDLRRRLGFPRVPIRLVLRRRTQSGGS